MIEGGPLANQSLRVIATAVPIKVQKQLKAKPCYFDNVYDPTFNQIDGTKLRHLRGVWLRLPHRLPTSFLTRRRYARPTEARQLEVVLRRRAVQATQAS